MRIFEFAGSPNRIGDGFIIEPKDNFREGDLKLSAGFYKFGSLNQINGILVTDNRTKENAQESTANPNKSADYIFWHKYPFYIYIFFGMAYLIVLAIVSIITWFLLDRLYLSKDYYDFNPFKLKFGFKPFRYKETLRTTVKPANDVAIKAPPITTMLNCKLPFYF